MSKPVQIEVCVDSVASAIAAEHGSASRLELCADLFEGGITPSIGLIESVRTRTSIPLHVLIRPRSGDFCYAEEEIEIMRCDIEKSKGIGADGIVLGILNLDGHIDIHQTRRLIDLARPLSVTFHRAFDMSADLARSLDDACATGADRILTSGGEQTCAQGSDVIASLVKSAGSRIAIMTCGGIRHDNAAALIERTGVREIHVGLSSSVTSPMRYRNLRVSMGKAPDREYQRNQVLEADIIKLRAAVDRL